MLPILFQSLWRDEAFSILLAQNSLPQIIRLTASDFSPPLYYFVLHYWMLFFGSGEVSTRSLSFVFHLLSSLTGFFIARRFGLSRKAGLILTFSLLSNPFLLQYAFEVRMYSLLSFLSLLTLYLTMREKEFLASLVLSAGVFTHNFGLLNFLSFVLGWVFFKKDSFSLKKFSQLALMPTISLFFWGSLLWTQWVKTSESFWVTQSPYTILLQSFLTYPTGDLFYPLKWPLFLVTISLILVVLFYTFRPKGALDYKLFFIPLSVAILPILIIITVSNLIIPIYHERYTIATIPMLIIVLGLVLHHLFRIKTSTKKVVSAILGIYLLLLGASALSVLTTTTKPPLKASLEQILLLARDGDVIIPQSIFNYLEVKYYVEKSGRDVDIFIFSTHENIPAYLGSVLYEPPRMIGKFPKGRTIWLVRPDGNYLTLQS